MLQDLFFRMIVALSRISLRFYFWGDLGYELTCVFNFLDLVKSLRACVQSPTQCFHDVVSLELGLGVTRSN